MDDDSFDGRTAGGDGESSDSARGDADAFPLDAVFRVLENPRRRYILYHLQECRYPATLTEIAEQVVAWETADPPDLVTEETLEQFRADLHHTHLPKLADSGIVEYDAEANVVTMAECTRPLDEFIEFTRQYEQYQHR